MKTLITTLLMTLTLNAFAVISPLEFDKKIKQEFAKNQEISTLLPLAYDQESGLNLFDAIIKKSHNVYHLYSINKMLRVNIIFEIDENSDYCGPARYHFEFDDTYEAFTGSGRFIFPIMGMSGETTGMGFETEQGNLLEVLLNTKELPTNGDRAKIAGYYIWIDGTTTHRKVLLVEDYIK